MSTSSFFLGTAATNLLKSYVPRLLRGLTVALVPIGVGACGGSGGTSSTTNTPQGLNVDGAPNVRIEVHTLEQKPRLSVIDREGDPSPALAVVFATGLGTLPTAALSAVVESRLVASGFPVHVRAHRSAFRLEWFVDAPAQVAPFFAALIRAMRDPIVAGAPEMALVTKRVDAVQKVPLDAPELDPVAACTGQPGIAPGQPAVDVSTPAFVTQLDAYRADALHAGRAAVSAVGPGAFGSFVFQELARSEGWPVGTAVVDSAPTADSIATYIAPPSARPGRVVVAVRVANAFSAVTIAERLAAPGSAFRGRLSGLSNPFRPAEVAGFARSHGGCVSITLDPVEPIGAGELERAAARAAVVARHEISIESSATPNTSNVVRQILSATDPRESASRAAWWALSTPVHGLPSHSAVVLGLPARSSLSSSGSSGQVFVQEHQRAMASLAGQVAERRVAVERGQGELWLLVGSSCGVADEGATDAGSSALSLLSAIAAQGTNTGVTMEPWIGAEGVGLFAHAPPKDDHETPADLARRISDAAMRALSPATPTTSSLVDARASMLMHLERTTGRGGIAFESLANIIAPEHPSWLDPYGTFTRVGASTLEGTRLRLRSLLDGPLRVAVLANMDVPQASEVGFSIDRWLMPRGPARTCSSATLAASTVRSSKLQLPRDAGLAQALVAARVPAVDAPGHDTAAFTAILLGGEGGLLERTFPPTSGVRATVRVTGTKRDAALVVDLRAPSDLLPGAIAGLKTLLTSMATSGIADADMQRATTIAARRVSEMRFDPRKRLVALWTGQTLASKSPPTAQAVTIFVGSTLNESTLVVVEAHPSN